MAEIKFTCPSCNQEIQGDERYCGMQINCPTCNTLLIVPQKPIRAPKQPRQTPAIESEAGQDNVDTTKIPVGLECPYCHSKSNFSIKSCLPGWFYFLLIIPMVLICNHYIDSGLISFIACCMCGLLLGIIKQFNDKVRYLCHNCGKQL
jgi:DNA-directed RNA polymerase subunit RPC12/RpoP